MKSPHDFTHERPSGVVRLRKQKAGSRLDTQHVCVGAGRSVRTTRDILDLGFETGLAAKWFIREMCENARDLLGHWSKRAGLGGNHLPRPAQARRSEREIALKCLKLAVEAPRGVSRGAALCPA